MNNQYPVDRALTTPLNLLIVAPPVPPIIEIAQARAPMTLTGIIFGGIVGGATAGPKGTLVSSFALGFLGAIADIEQTNSIQNTNMTTSANIIHGGESRALRNDHSA